MDAVISHFRDLQINIFSLLKTGGILLLGLLMISLVARFIFGQKSLLSGAVSSAIGIVFICTIAIIIESVGANLQILIAPFPLVSLKDDYLVLFSFCGADYTVICSQILGLVVLSFLVNLADRWIPTGKGVFTWVFFRCLTVVIGYAFHLLVVWLFTTYLPEQITVYAPVILLVLLVLMLLTGALKLIVGAVLTTVNPLIGAFYTFFFANVIGRQLTRAVLTTALLSGFVMLLNHLGCGMICIAPSVLVAYIPFAIMLIAAWYVVRKAM